jgi:uncharacterized membrane protein
MSAIKQLGAIAVIMLILDLTWLTANGDYNKAMFAAVQGGRPLEMRLIPAIIAYTIMLAAIWLFVVRETDRWQDAAKRGALLGFFMYGLYDATNYATLKSYTARFAITDALWGTILFAVVGASVKALGL